MVFGLSPGPGDLFRIGAGSFLQDESPGRQQFQQRLPMLANRFRNCLVRPRLAHGAGHGEDGDLLDRLPRALRGEIEAPNRVQLVSPPFESRGRRHAEPVDVDDAAPNAEFSYFGDRGYSTVAHELQGGRCLGKGAGAGRGPIGRAPFETQSLLPERGGDSGAFQCRPSGGDQDSKPTLEEGRDRFHPLARDLIVRLFLTQRFALGIERDRHVGQVLQIAEPALGVRRCRTDDGEQALRGLFRQPGREHGSTRTGKPSDADQLSSTRQALAQIERDRGSAQGVEKGTQGHARLLHPLASSTSLTASANASHSRGACRSARPT